MHQPSVSIIVPVYNVEPYVEDCIRSVMRQTYDGSIECIVVDDFGSDNSMATVESVIADYIGPISFKILHHEHNRGLSAARNTGMDEATGDYLFFLDSDDEMTCDCLVKLAEPLDREWYDIVIGNVQYLQIYSSNIVRKTKGIQEIQLPDKTLLKAPWILRTHRKEWGGVAWNRLYRTAFLHKNHLRFKEGLIYEDNLWSFQIACLASSLFIVNHKTYIHKKREGSIMDLGSRQEYIKSLIIIIQEMGIFVQNFQINNSDTFLFFNNFFCNVMNFYSSSHLEFESIYKTLRPYVPASTIIIIRNNRYHIKKHLRDIHYLLPAKIAFRWQFYIYFPFRNILSKQICRKKH